MSRLRLAAVAGKIPGRRGFEIGIPRAGPDLVLVALDDPFDLFAVRVGMQEVSLLFWREVALQPGHPVLDPLSSARPACDENAELPAGF